MTVSWDHFAQQVVASSLISADSLDTIVSSSGSDVPTSSGKDLAQLLVKQKRLTAFQARQIYAGKGKSLVLGNYVILDKIGQGGMGVVLKAEHRRMKRIVALKLLDPAVTKTPEATKRFEREIHVTAQLEHPNVVTAHDADEANGTHFLVMQYVEGTDLASLVSREGALPSEQAINYILQAARGLEYAHRRGVIHRDIKPANLLLDQHGTLKVLDMGLARLESAGSLQDQLTGTNQIMGTVDYMAPEQGMDTKTADARADIYSLGVTLWYLLTGRPLYDGETVVKKLMAHQNSPVPVLQSACPQASSELGEVFARMVAKDPAARYQNMSDVISDLQRCPEVGADVRSARTFGSDPSKESFVRTNDGGTLAVTTPVLGAHIASSAGEQPTISLPGPATETTATHQAFALVSPTRMSDVPSIKPAPARKPRWPGVRSPKIWIAAGAGGLALLLAAIVFFVRTSQGVIRVEITDPEIEVEIKGTGIVLKQADQGKDVKLSPGDHTLVVERGDFKFETNKLVLKKGDDVTVRVELLAGEIQVLQGQEVIGEKKIPSPSVAAKNSEPWHGWPADAPPPAIIPFDAQQARQHQEAWAKHLGVPVEYENSFRMKFVLIPPGEFTMGSADEEVNEAMKVVNPFWHNNVRSQAPQHKVVLTKPFYLAVHEVTQGHFEKLLGRNPATFSAEGNGKSLVADMDTSHLPVEMASWYDAAEYCVALSKLEKQDPAYVQEGEKAKPAGGTGYRLPTEAQWEFACRAGTTTRFWNGDDDKDVEKIGWTMANSNERTHPVGELPANPFGLYDTHGNVAEWVQDWYWHPYYQKFKDVPAIDPPGAAMEDNGSSGRIHKGGAWYGEAKPVTCYVWHRYAQVPSARSGTIGFRVALPVEAVKGATAK